MNIPTRGGDVRALHRYVTELVAETNALLNLRADMKGRASGVGQLNVLGGYSELRIRVGAKLPIGTGSKKNPAIFVVSSDNPSPFGESINFICTLPSDARNTVTFLVDGAVISVNAVFNGVAMSAIVSDLAAGPHVVTAAYSGDLQYNPATATMTQIVNGLSPPTVALTFVPASPVNYGVTVSFVADVRGSNPIPPAPNITGEVNFTMDGTDYGNFPLTFHPGPPQPYWEASTALTNIPLGSHTVVATYLSDNNYGRASDTQTLIIQPPVTCQLAIVPNPGNDSEQVTCYGSVRGPSGQPPATGNCLIVKDGGGIVTVPLDSSGNFVAGIGPFPDGNYDISFDYLGGNYHSAVSNHITLQIIPSIPDGNLTCPAAVYNVYLDATVTIQLFLDTGESGNFKMQIFSSGIGPPPLFGPNPIELSLFGVYLSEGFIFLNGQSLPINTNFNGFIEFECTFVNGVATLAFSVAPLAIPPQGYGNSQLGAIGPMFVYRDDGSTFETLNGFPNQSELPIAIYIIDPIP